MSLAGIVRLIDRLRADFGAGFIITLAPVAAALVEGGGNLSGFGYRGYVESRGAIDDPLLFFWRGVAGLPRWDDVSPLRDASLTCLSSTY